MRLGLICAPSTHFCVLPDLSPRKGVPFHVSTKLDNFVGRGPHYIPTGSFFILPGSFTEMVSIVHCTKVLLMSWLRYLYSENMENCIQSRASELIFISVLFLSFLTCSLLEIRRALMQLAMNML